MQTRNSWAHAVVTDWDSIQFNAAFSDMVDLAKLLPNSAQLLSQLKEDKEGRREIDFPQKKFLLAVSHLRTSIKDGQFDKVQDKLRKLEDEKGKEIYLERKFKKSNDGVETDDIEQMILCDEFTLLKGQAGSGKSSVVVKVMQQ